MESSDIINFLQEVGGIVLIIVACLIAIIIFVSIMDRHKRPPQNPPNSDLADEVSKGESSE